MELERARSVIETSSPETVNQYLRFGWKLVNQHLLESQDGRPPRVNYVLASYRALEDTKQVTTLDEPEQVNAYLSLGWRLIEKYVAQVPHEAGRNEVVRFVLVWSNDEPPQLPTMGPATPRLTDPKMFDHLGDFSQLPPLDQTDEL